MHIEDRFHPDMGYQVNYFAEFHNPDTEFHILSSRSLSLWKGTDAHDVFTVRDREFEKKYDVTITRLNAYRSRGQKHNIWLRDLFGAIGKISPDIVYTHGLETATSIRIILSGLDKHSLVAADTHTLMNQKMSAIKKRIYYPFLHRVYVPVLNRKNVTVFYTAEENKRILLNLYGVREENVLPCLIGTNLNDYRFDEQAGGEIRRDLGIAPDSKLILYTGKMNNRKKPHLLLQAVKAIEDRLAGETHLVLVGAQDKEYVQKNFDVKFSDKVTLHILEGVSNRELFRYYSAANVVVFPKENTLSALDAQACKLPVIMERDSTNEERLREGGLLYEGGNIEDLGRKILSLLRNAELRATLSEKGYEYVRSNYDYRKIVQAMESSLIERLDSYRRRA